MKSSASQATATRSRQGLAWASFICGLIFPLTYLSVVALVIARHLGYGANPFLVSLYTVFDYFEWPFPIAAVIMGHLALAQGVTRRSLAWTGLALGYVSLLALGGTLLALVITSHIGQ